MKKILLVLGVLSLSGCMKYDSKREFNREEIIIFPDTVNNVNCYYESRFSGGFSCVKL